MLLETLSWEFGKGCEKHFSSARIFSSLSSHPPPQDLVLISFFDIKESYANQDLYVEFGTSVL